MRQCERGDKQVWMIERKEKIEFERTDKEVREGGRSSGDAQKDNKDRGRRRRKKESWKRKKKKVRN
jgi:hypothetical protein